MTTTPLCAALTPDDIHAVSPALASFEDLWKRLDLSPRDRSMITVAALTARIQTIGMLHYFYIALDSGVSPGELSEIVTHLAFYSGWSNALSAVPILKEIFAQRGIGSDQLPEFPLNYFLLTKRPKINARLLSSRTSAQSLQELCSTQPICFSMSSGYVRISASGRSLTTLSALIASGQGARKG